MISRDQLKHIVHMEERSQRDTLLLIMSVERARPKKIPMIKKLGGEVGVPNIRKWNLTHILKAARGYAIESPEGWELNPVGGAKYVQGLLSATDLNLVITNAGQALRSHLLKIKAPESAEFVEEAIGSFESRRYRAAVVLAWEGAMSVLHHHVFHNHLTAFDKEAERRNAEWKGAKRVDDLGRLREGEQLEVFAAIGVIGKNEKETLKSLSLQLRNSCGHPNSLKVAEHLVASHIELLILNVFAKF